MLGHIHCFVTRIIDSEATRTRQIHQNQKLQFYEHWIHLMRTDPKNFNYDEVWSVTIFLESFHLHFFNLLGIIFQLFWFLDFTITLFLTDGMVRVPFLVWKYYSIWFHRTTFCPRWEKNLLEIAGIDPGLASTTRRRCVNITLASRATIQKWLF